MGEIVLDIIKFLFNDALTTFVSPILGIMQSVALSPETILKFKFIDIIFPAIKGIAYGLLLINTSWHGLKSMLSGFGLAAEEPQVIAVKTFFAGLLIFWIKDIMMKFIEIGGNMITYIMASVNGGFEGSGLFQMLIALLSTGGLLLILAIILIFHCAVLFWKMFLRLAMCAILLVASPLAVASMVSKETEGFWQGFIKLFIGNIIIQLIQSTCVVAVIISLSAITPSITSTTTIDAGLFFNIVLIIAMVSITNKLEDIIRDISVNVGIGRDMQGVLSRVQSLSYAASSVSRFVMTFGR